MATESITEPIVSPIGIAGASTPLFTNTSNIYDIAIGGQPFLLGASDKYPYQRQTATYRKQQFDNSKEIGEQSFEGWWLRSQSSFHLGAGINYLDPYLSENVQFRFNDSAGVDVWTQGQVTMLPATENVFALTGNDINMFGAIDSLDQDCVFVSEDTVLTRIAADGTDATIAYGGSGSDITSLIQDGLYYYAANATNIYRGLLTGTGATGTAYYPTNNAKVVTAYVKQRIVAGIGEKIYEITQSRGGTNPDASDARYTHPDSGWTWSAIVEGPTAVYASGYRGNNSSIFKFTLSTAGVMPTLTNAVTAADFPDDEHVTSLGVYLGTYMLIGTNKGIRVGVIDANGDINYGPLTYEKADASHVSAFAFEDRFAYATITNNIDGKSGLIRIDLSQETEPGRYAYAKDLSSGATGICKAVALVGDTGRAAFAVAGSGVYFQHATNKVASGFLDTGYIRYATIEKKYFKLIKPRFNTPMFGTCTISTKEVDGDVTSIITIANGTPALNTDLATNVNQPQEELAFRFTFGRDTTDTTKGPVFDGYQVKSLPAVVRARQLTIPLVNYDFETDRYGIQNGYETRAWDRLQALENLEAAGDTVIIQDFTTGEQITGLIEQLSFERTTPSDRRYTGFGGIVYVSIRTV
jgi:hypothetical protein